MHTLRRVRHPLGLSSMGLMVCSLLVLGVTSCQSPHEPQRRLEPHVDPGWPKGNNFFTQVSYQTAKAPLPTIQGAEYVHDDELCITCHEVYAKTFMEGNVHRNQSCEECHGPASKHLESRGKEPGTILNPKKLAPQSRSELCLRCHEENTCAPGARWRTSVHAAACVSCIDCHTSHYNVPAGTKPTTVKEGPTTMAPPPSGLQNASYQQPAAPEPPATANPAPDAAGPNLMETGRSPLPARPVSLSADQKPPLKPSLRGTSNHLGAVSPYVCYKCHGDFAEFQRVASPHQICGPNGFNCTNCHDPHGNLLDASRKDLCLTCHARHAPTMAWHSSIHNMNGVYCTDCHNPHPHTCVPRFVAIDHEQVKRPKRIPMCVDQPETCYKCHRKIYGLNQLPSHHPIREGKMVCSDCHDPHGQEEKNLKEASINLVCYRCHADKQGPYIYEHPPVTENCAICHEPHGTVENNLLRQATTFLCLRCHSGHNNHNQKLYTASGYTGANASKNNTPNASYLPSFYTNCTQCHQNIHGTDRVSNSGLPRFTR